MTWPRWLRWRWRRQQWLPCIFMYSPSFKLQCIIQKNSQHRDYYSDIFVVTFSWIPLFRMHSIHCNALHCTSLHCTALHCTPIEWQFCNLRTSICYYLDCKLQMINLTSELPVNACIHAPLEHCSTYKNWSFIYLCKLIACCSTGKYVCMHRTAYTIWC